jgi:AraC-like DNA-binding protein
MGIPPHLVYAQDLLHQNLAVTQVHRRVFVRGMTTQDEVIATFRFILVLRGSLDYTIDGKTVRMTAGTQFLVPAWVRRVWSVPQSPSCENIWCEFDEPSGLSSGPDCFLRRLRAPALTQTVRHYQRLAGLLRAAERGDEWKRLQLELALKAMLVDFWHEAEPSTGRERQSRQWQVHPRIKLMLRFAAERYRERDAVALLYREAELSRNYFRILFARAVGGSPQAYIQRLRLREARRLINETNWPLKRISSEVGYDDPLYFSRLYHKFWQHSPSQERAPSGTNVTPDPLTLSAQPGQPPGPTPAVPFSAQRPTMEPRSSSSKASGFRAR